MEKYVEIIKLIEKIFGKGAVSKSLGTRTNVVRFPRGKQGLDPTKNAFDVQGTSQTKPHLVETIKNSIEDRIGDLGQMNDSELLMYKGNLQRLDNHLNPPSAEVIEAGSKQRVTGEGLEKLIEEQGLVASPNTPLGSAQFNIKRAEQEMNKIIKENDLDSLLMGAGKDQLSWNRLHNEGLVRAVTRQILSEDIKAGKIKGLTLDDLGTSREPIDYFRKIYGEGALEQLDSLTPEFNRLATEQEAAKLARSKFKIEPKETPVDESKTYEELEQMIKKGEPEEKADGGSIGLDYLMGFDNRPKYKSGGDVKKILDIIAKANKELKGKKSMETVNPKTGEVTTPKNPITTAERQTIDYDAMNAANELSLKHKEAAYAFDQIQPIDIYDKIAADRVAEIMAEIKGKDYYDLSQKQRSVLYKKAQSFLDEYIKIDRINKAVKKFNAGEELQAIDERYLSKFFPESGVTFESKVKPPYKQGDIITEENFGSTPFAPSQETLDNLEKAKKMSSEMSLEQRMNKVLNQYDKSMFIKNEEGMVDVTNPENIEKMALLLKRDHPEIYNQIFKLTEDLNQKQQLLDFDVTGRKPNKDGGLNYLLGI